MKLAILIIGLFVTIPLSIALQYMILKRIEGTTDLMWFLFWFNAPFSILIRIVAEIPNHKKETTNGS